MTQMKPTIKCDFCGKQFKQLIERDGTEAVVCTKEECVAWADRFDPEHKPHAGRT